VKKEAAAVDMAIAGPLLGGIVGGGLYQLAIRPFLPRSLEQAQ
jgi:hypothetical protein